MTFVDIPVGSAVFIDANTFIYHFNSVPDLGPACTAFLERIERKEIEGWTTPHLLAEVSHRLMTLEACQQLGWPYAGIAARLARNPTALQNLVQSHQALIELRQLSLNIVAVEERHVVEATDFSRQYGLLTNDALTAVMMKESQIANLASHDSDFDRVPTITRFSPL
jgi:predicted nucleic acid-binding protein